MPFYEYRCEACNYTCDTLLTWAQARDNPFFCPNCYKQMTRLISIPSVFIFDFPSLDAQDIMNKEDKRK